MSRIEVSAPGLGQPLSVSLAESELLLIGRRPDVATAARPHDAPQTAPRTLAVPSARVSENHAWVWRRGGAVFVCDAGSRNGTRLALGDAAVSLADPQRVALDLAGDARIQLDAPAPVEWASDEEFRERVAGAVARWLDDARTDVTADLVRMGPRDAPGPQHIPLGGEWFLGVRDREGAARRTESAQATRLVEAVWRYVHDMRGRQSVEREQAHDDLVLASPLIRKVHRRIAEVAARGMNAILLGESGVGKSVLARCLHLHSDRRDRGQFVATNVGEDSDDPKYFQKKLFGARRGAGAHIDRDEIGLARRADGGVLFLDEVAELSGENQAMLLRFLDTGRFRRLGDAGDVDDQRADVRLVVGTNADLRRLVRERRFREDLWHRLAGEVIEIPPLRERREDIAAYLRAAEVALPGRTGPAFELLSADARHLLVQGYDWPGNFRALAHLVRRLPLYADGAVIERRHCEEALAAVRVDAFDEPSSSPLEPPPAALLDAAWADVLPRAQRLFPAWLRVRPPRPSDPLELSRAATPGGIGFRIFVDEVVRPLCMARALGVEHWDELPRRPDPSYHAMATRLGYGDGRSVLDALRVYIELKRLDAQAP